MPSRTTRAIAIAASAAFLSTSVELRMATASPSSKAPGQELSAASGTDFSARKKRRRGGGDAAAFAAIAGTIGAIVASQAHRKRYRDYYYHGGPAYYGGYYAAPRYYGGYAPYSYAPSYYPRHGGYGYGYRHGYGHGHPGVAPPSSNNMQSPGHL